MLELHERPPMRSRASTSKTLRPRMIVSEKVAELMKCDCLKRTGNACVTSCSQTTVSSANNNHVKLGVVVGQVVGRADGTNTWNTSL